jgi:uncharacterized zinc-type alcohol dehydrogenase-like protein
MKINAFAALDRAQPLRAWTYETKGLAPHEVIVKVKACGICHSDVHMIDNDWGFSSYPLVPGHEVVGEIVERGAAVEHLKSGARVGVGWQRSACLHCENCLRGDENLCDESQGVISNGYGGFADYLVMDSRFCFPLPEEITTELGGPLMCGGITVYSALKHAGMKSGQHIGVIGVGGLGHMAVQFASKLGNTVTVFTTSNDKAEESARHGAHEAVLLQNGKPTQAPKHRFDILVSTAPAAIDCGLYLDLLAGDGTLTFVGVPDAPLTFPLLPLLVKRRRVMASPIGGRAEIVEMLEIAVRFGVRPVIEKFPMGNVNTALDKVRKNTVRYRAVLVA